MSSTIKAAILALKSRIADAYTAISNKGGTLPETQDSANLATAIASIPSGSSVKVKLASALTFNNLKYEDMGETQIVYARWFSFDSICQGCTNMKKFDIREIEFRDGVNSWFNRTTFYGCSNVEEIYLNNSDLSKTTPTYGNYDVMFGGCTKLRVLRVGDWCNRSINISQAGAMTRETIVDFLNDLPTPVDSSQTITMGNAKLNLLTAEDRAIATNKGWTLA